MKITKLNQEKMFNENRKKSYIEFTKYTFMGRYII